jgi:hypothetical protein
MGGAVYPTSPLYNALTQLLDSRAGKGELDVHILPGDQQLPEGQFYLYHESPDPTREASTIAIQKKVLTKAFLSARQILFQFIDDVPARSDTLLQAASVILLFDPEYLTAANARKRAIAWFLQNKPKGWKKRLQAEMWFTNFIITLRLPRHNKSPTMWAHKRWLMKQFNPAWVDMEPRDFHKKEAIQVVVMSGDRHPKNYYAWDFMRWWYKNHTDLLTLSNDGYRTIRRDTWNEILDHKSWCLRHVSDISMWSFLLWFLTRMTLLGEEIEILKVRVANDMLKAATTMRLKNESLWITLGILLYPYCYFGRDQVRADHLRALTDLRRSEPEGTPFRRVLDRELSRVEAYENQ